MSEQEKDDQELRALFSRLPRSIEPERDLWAGIGDRLEQRAAPAVARRKFVTLPWAIAASVASIAVGALLAIALQHRASVVKAPVLAAASVAEYSFVPASTDAMRQKLRAECAAQMANLPAKTREKVERDLELIDSSMRDIQTALAKDPGNALLQDLLVTIYQNELNTLANVQLAASAAHSEVST